MNVFNLRDQLIEDYSSYISSFIRIKDKRISDYVEGQLKGGLLWPDPLIQLNPSFGPGSRIDELVHEGVLHEECQRIFRLKPTPYDFGKELRLHKHQEEAVRIARNRENYVLTTGTGSGKSLAYIIPIVDYVLRRGSRRGIQAIIVYPMNALANSQLGELNKFINHGYPNQKGPISFARYTGQESDEEKLQIMANPPDILLTNYVMLELILTRPQERRTLVNAAQGLHFLVLDELHTYRGRQGSDVAMLVRRVREALNAEDLQCVGTSATLAGVGTFQEQQVEVAKVASQFFGAKVKPENIIGETLRRSTSEVDISDPEFISRLKQRVSDPVIEVPKTYQAFVNDPLSVWIESTFGVTNEEGSTRLIRKQPRSISGREGGARELSRVTGVAENRCQEVLEEGLLAGYQADPNPDTGFPAFAFRVNQFISRGDTAYASIETEEQRHVTAYGQKFVPGTRNKILLPLVFCRECGQEYYSVYRQSNREDGKNCYLPRKLGDPKLVDTGDPGFLYMNTQDPWPLDPEAEKDRLPDDWLEVDAERVRVRSNRQKNRPEPVQIDALGIESADGMECHFVSAPFRFCLNCGVSYNFRQRSDIGKLAELGAGGRSTATTILSLSTIQGLRKQDTLPKKARKLLSFTDNRQDASLQAGHFNDFIEVSVLRGALYRAANGAGEDGVSYDELTQRVFEALQLPLEMYAQDPDVRFQAKVETERALRDVIGYRLYHDLRRGWRVTSPNLEQCGLLEIKYPWLEEVCKAEDVWQDFHPTLSDASPETRSQIAEVLLDYMRRELVIKVNYLDSAEQERFQQRSGQYLIPPWALDENEKLVYAHALFPRSRRKGDSRDFVYLSPRGGFGLYLRRATTFPDYTERQNLDDTQQIIQQLFEGLRVGGLVEIIQEPREDGEVPGYQLPASAMKWVASDGKYSFHDPIRVPNLPDEGGRTNPYFVNYYRAIAGGVIGLEAREHTAQVPYEVRELREEKFREGTLPILYCSPTMELGVDISQLNAVNMRNVPPTPANYAQRSGRAGRSGQPALVFTYCTTGSPHDQYFFKRPEKMVAGAVTPPRLDLTNEDLLRAHLHAIWLSETGLSLGTSLVDILDLAGEDPALELQEYVHDGIFNQEAVKRARLHAGRIIHSIREELGESDWFQDDWLENVFSQVAHQFDHACDRWRDLYRAARKQQRHQDRIILDVTRSAAEKKQAKRLRREAESQLELLTEARNIIQSDFYSYRYFASEGFLPGYNFPRLPLSAYIPARRKRIGRDEFISRPRFLAISEFGPRSLIYHEGSRYAINRVIMPVTETDEGQVIATSQIKLCPNCGYMHPVTSGDGLDLCEWCQVPLEAPLSKLFRLRNVSTKRRDKINSDEEERVRIGFEICTGVRFPEHNGRPSARSAIVQNGDEVLAKLSYGDAVNLRRINLGWRNRKNPNQYGFVLDVGSGYWAKNEAVADDPSDPLSQNIIRVIPFVEDRKNCLLFEPVEHLERDVFASLTAALKNAIQVVYQLEDNELAAEPLPSHDVRRLILFYEASEGGAGVLRRLVTDPNALPKVALEALSLCHFDPVTGEDLRRAPRAQEDCEAACYDCLMSYRNQMDHLLLDRQKIKELLLKLSHADVRTSPEIETRAEHLRRLKNLSISDLEIKWLDFLEEHDCNLPTKAQHLIPECHTRPDFLFDQERVAIYIDGPHHLYPERRERDAVQTACMEDIGYIVIRFGLYDDWSALIEDHKYLFGGSA